MQKLKFEIDWVDAERINGPELSATWASLRIYAGDSVITRVLDARAKIHSRSGWRRTGGS